MSSPGITNKNRSKEKGHNDIPAVRRAKISDLVKRQGIVRVDDLSEEFGVSVITIRRDLDILEKKGIVERTHGGAMKTNHLNSESAYSEKRNTNTTIKQAIGAKTASLIDEGEALLINSGTTTAEVIKALQFKKHVRVITNNVAVVRDLHPDASLDVIFTGGSYRSTTCCVVGEFADLMLENIHASKTILGVDGLSFKHGLTSSNYQEALISRKMIQHSQGPVIIVTDYSKIGKITNFSIAPLDRISAVVTDTRMTHDISQEFENAGITLHLIDAEKEKPAI
jgi:DeoR/GlpR family transcriptional regulator of sugar metabolism